MRSSTSSSRALLGRGALFLGLFALMAILLHRVLTAGYVAYTRGDNLLWARIVRGGADAGVLIVGSSRAQHGFDCTPVRAATGLSCLNMGLNATRPNLQRTPLHLYLAHNTPPRAVVISVDTTSFSLRREIPDPMQVFPFLDERELLDSLTPLDPDLVLYQWIPLYAFAKTGYTATNQAARGLLGQRRPYMRRDDGFEPNDLAWDGLFDDLVKKNPGGMTAEIEPEAVQAFEDLVSIAARGAALLVIVYPPELAEAHALFLNRGELFQRFRDTARAHGGEFLDYSDHPLTRSREYFYNSAHLNARGA
ncbi:MAG: hypothetical protein ABIV93_14085, partial [Byssovorax sp.]